MAKENQAGAKGGTRYPKDNLEKCVGYSKKLVSKTHNGPQPENIILTGVFGSGTSLGKIRVSSTKQFGLLGGDVKGYIATDLAKKINSATDEDINTHLIKAFLTPKIFKNLYNTFVNDIVTDSKLKQQVLNFQVHPDNADECVKVFKESILYAKVGVMEDDKLRIITLEKKSFSEETSPDINSGKNGDEGIIKNTQSETQNQSFQSNQSTGTISNINVNIDVDPSMDPEKLEKLLKLLKNYGAI